MFEKTRIFPSRLNWTITTKHVDDVPRNTEALRLVSKAVGFEKLIEFKQLSTLWCFGIDQKKLKQISECKSLTRLYLDYQLRFEDLSPLYKLPLLDVLRLDSCSKINSLKALAELGQLTGLAIENFKNVHEINPLSELTNLRELAVEGSIWTRMKINSLEPIANLSNLEYLSLSNLKVMDESLAPLHELKNLKELLIANFYPAAEFALLAGKLPGCKCQWFEPFISTNLRCDKCGEATRVMLSGKGTSMLCTRCDAGKLQRHVEEFERIKKSAREEE